MEGLLSTGPTPSSLLSSKAGTQRSQVNSRLGGAIAHPVDSQDHLRDDRGKSLLGVSVYVMLQDTTQDRDPWIES